MDCNTEKYEKILANDQKVVELYLLYLFFNECVCVLTKKKLTSNKDEEKTSSEAQSDYVAANIIIYTPKCQYIWPF